MRAADWQISIHAPHTRSDLCCLGDVEDHHPISIHAPHTRSDQPLWKRPSANLNFNPRSSYEERRGSPALSFQRQKFQSTLLIRGATTEPERAESVADFNPRSSYEERPVCPPPLKVIDIISIHAPHTRSDSQSSQRCSCVPQISIHAPHTRSDNLLPQF